MSGEAVIQVRDLHESFGHTRAVRGVSMLALRAPSAGRPCLLSPKRSLQALAAQVQQA
ncbi:hypothetical protein [Nocardiopsis nanhaiensis]